MSGISSIVAAQLSAAAYAPISSFQNGNTQVARLAARFLLPQHLNDLFFRNPVITKNEAFLLSNPETRRVYETAYESTSALYYNEKPTFADILAEIGRQSVRL
jgi:hypothetical protein